jgi:hypothetical protein
MDLHDFVEHVPVLIDGPPKIALLATDRDYDLVEMSNVMAAWDFALQAAGVFGPELYGPGSDRLVGNHDAPLEQHLFDEAQAQGKPEIEPDRMSDNLTGESVTLVAYSAVDHERSSHRKRLPRS